MPADATESLASERVSAPERPLLGKVVDQRYRAIAHIGSGGMADVYEVEHVALGRRLAMKVLRQTRTGNPHLARRFSREARAASRIESEHVVSIHDYGMLPEGNPYFVMELLRGQNLRGLLAGEPRLPVARAVNLAIDVCLGLHAAHAAGLVHRDLKPENLWLSRGDDGRELCVLLDFGVARFDGAHTTGDGVLVGTARYMSPEQIGSEQAPGPASDLFSLGSLLYECLTGAPPFVADSLERTLFRILNDTPRAACELNAEVPTELSNIIDKVLSKAPEQRYRSALDFAAALRPYAGVPRLLPTLAAASGQGLSDDTLAEEPVVDAQPYRDASPDSERGRARAETAPSRRAIPLSFVAGLAVGGAALFAFRSPAPPAAARESGVMTAPVAAPPPATVARAEPNLSREDTTVAAPPATPSSSARPKPHAPAASPTATTKSARPEPPRPNFDGRNPYLQ